MDSLASVTEKYTLSRESLNFPAINKKKLTEKNKYERR